MLTTRIRLHLAVLLTAAVACLGLALASASAATSTRRKSQALSHSRARITGSMAPEGMFDSCSLNGSLSTCEQDLFKMRQAGLQVAVVSIQWDSLSDISAYASYAKRIGMSVMWELDDPGFWGGAWMGSSASADWAAFATACGCASPGQILDYMIRWLGSLPATYGYYAADDSTITRGELGGLKQYVREIKAADPNRLVMIGSNQSDGTSLYPSGAAVGNEIYPETTTSLMPYDHNLATWLSIAQSVTQDQRAATDFGTPSAFILQAFSFGDNIDDGEAVGVCNHNMAASRCASLLQYPSAAVQLELRNEVLEHAHPQLILWYTYSQATKGNRWDQLSSVLHSHRPVIATPARAKRELATSRRERRRDRRDRRRRHKRQPTS